MIRARLVSSGVNRRGTVGAGVGAFGNGIIGFEVYGVLVWSAMSDLNPVTSEAAYTCSRKSVPSGSRFSGSRSRD